MEKPYLFLYRFVGVQPLRREERQSILLEGMVKPWKINLV